MNPDQPTSPIPYPHHTDKPKRKRTGLWIGLTIGALALIACCGGGAYVATKGADTASKAMQTAASGAADVAKTPDRQASPTLQPVGTTLPATFRDGSLEATVTKVAWSKTGCPGALTKPETGHYLVADVTVKVTKGTGSVNPLYFEFFDVDGAKHTSIEGMFAKCADLGAGNGLPTGETRKGQVVYDVKRGPGRLVWYTPLMTYIGAWEVPA